MSFVSKRISRTTSFNIDAGMDEVFPLLCPKRELEWIDGWKYDMIYSESGFNEEGCMFKSKFPFGVEVIWTCTKHDKRNHIVEFLNYSNGLFIQNFNIVLSRNTDGTTKQTISLALTSLSEKGNRFLEKFSRNNNGAVSGLLEKALNHYFKTGTMLKSDSARKHHKLFSH